MSKLKVFNQVSLDGFFTDAKGDISWAHKSDPEWDAFVAGNAGGNGMLLFGRITYEMMVSFWPTPAAKQTAPEVADGMNRMPKVVFSKTLDRVTWQNTKLVKADPAAEVRALKKSSGPDMVILGSGTIVSLLAQENLIDEYQLIVNPLALGRGRTLFDGVKRPVPLKLTETRRFKNGNVLLSYQAA